MRILPSTKFGSIEEYFSVFPPSTQLLLEELRKTIKQAAPPKAVEVISYNMPAIKLNGVLVYYAAYAKHIGFYPTGTGIKAFKDELSGYKGAKGSVQFPLDQPIPFDLIAKIVKFRTEEDAENAKAKKNSKKRK